MNIKKLFNTFTVLLMCFSMAGIVSCSALSEGESDSASGKADSVQSGPTRLCITVGKLTSARSTITPANLNRSDISRAALFYTYTDTEYGDVEKLIKEWEVTDSKNAIDVMEGDSAPLDGGLYDFVLRLYSTVNGSEKLVAVSENKNYLVEAGPNAINFTTSIPVEGQGDIDVTLNWADDKRIGKVQAGLFTLDDDTVAVEGYDYSDCEAVSATEVKYAKTDVTAGHYYIKFNVYDSTNTTIISRFMDVIIVEPGRLSSDTRVLTAVDTLYTITYDTNGGKYVDGYEAVTVHNAYTGVLLPTEAKIKKTGYKFEGWLDVCTDDCSDTTEETRRTLLPTLGTDGNGDIIPNPLITQDHTYQAQWTAETYTLSFKDAGGKLFSGDSSSAGAHTYGAETTLPTPEKTGYTFGGWYTDEDCSGTSYTVISANDITADTTLYAKWTPVTYTIHFDRNDSSVDLTKGSLAGSYADITYTYDDTITLDDVTVVGGYVTEVFTYKGSDGNIVGKFVGWAYSSGKAQVYGNKQTIKNILNSEGEVPADGETITLYAKWIAGKYAVNFDANGGSGTTDGTEGEMNTGVTLPECKFSKTGYTFTGWGTASNGGTVYSAGATTSKALSSEIGGTVTLYAQWQANTYIVNFSTAGIRTNSRDQKDSLPAVEKTVTVEGSMSSITMTYDETKALSLFTLTPPTGYKFVSWNTNADGTGAAYSDAAEVTNLTATVDGRVTLYPVFSPVEYTVTYDGNKGVPSNGTSTVYGRMGVQHTEYDSTDLVSVNSFHREGYIMDGWTIESEGSDTLITVDTGYLGNLASTEGANVTLYAKWTPITYSVTYNSNGGTFGTYDGSVETQTYDAVVNAPAVTERTGYTFKGWSTSGNAVTADNLCQATDATNSTVKNVGLNAGESITLYAVWELNTYDIAYTVNGGSWKNTTYVKTYDTVNGATLPTARDIYRSGYAFAGWKNNSGAVEIEIAPGTTGNKSYTAQWRANCRALSLSDSFMLFTGTGATKQCSANPTFSGSETPVYTTIWTSADTSIATVDDNGLIKSVGTGTTTVTAKVDDQIATCVVVVKASNSTLEYNTGTSSAGSFSYGKQYYTNNQYLLAFYNTNWGNIDFIGRPNTSASWQKTTYAYCGWSPAVVSSNSSANYSVTSKPVIAYDRRTGINYVVMYLILTNKSETQSATYKLGYHADVQIGSNDYAPIQQTNYGFRMWDDSAHIELQAHTHPVQYSEVTAVDHEWMGHYWSRYTNCFETYNAYSNPLTGVDSSIAFSWNNIPLGPGESAIRCVYFTLKGI